MNYGILFLYNSTYSCLYNIRPYYFLINDNYYVHIIHSNESLVPIHMPKNRLMHMITVCEFG